MERVVYKQLSKTAARTYATAAIPHDEYHKKYDLHPWPKSKKPTPHEIFNLDQSAQNLPTLELNKILKNCYVKYVKIYHPDVSKNLVLTDDKGRQLTEEAKRQRYDEIQYAYDVLKDPRRRVAYNRYQSTSWENYGKNPNPSSFEAYRMANAHRKKYDFKEDEQFWKAGTWEDYYRMRHNRAPPTEEELNKNKYKILVGVLAVAALVVTLQVMTALENAAQFRRRAGMRNFRSGTALDESLDNYGQGTTPVLRLRRFLTSRRASLADRTDDKTLDELRENDQEIVRKYAQQRLASLEGAGKL
jgi:hypothetical protein